MENLTEQDHKKIRTAIKDAEKKTSAEIFAVLALQSDDYRFIATFFLSLWIFIASFLLAIWLLWKGYNVELIQFTLAQLAAFVFGYLLILIFPSLAVLMTPRSIKHKRARANGINQFLAHGIHNTRDRTGILVFVSYQERYAEILVDTAIEEKVGQEFWLEQIQKLVQQCKEDQITKGYVETIKAAGEHLKRPFPRGRKKLNELEDKMIVI